MSIYCAVRGVNANAALATQENCRAARLTAHVHPFIGAPKEVFFHSPSSFPNNTETKKSPFGLEGGGLDEPK